MDFILSKVVPTPRMSIWVIHLLEICLVMVLVLSTQKLFTPAIAVIVLMYYTSMATVLWVDQLHTPHLRVMHELPLLSMATLRGALWCLFTAWLITGLHLPFPVFAVTITLLANGALISTLVTLGYVLQCEKGFRSPAFKDAEKTES
jgi:hypothetical protein